MPNTVRFHRVLRATPEKVYRAFLDADAMVQMASAERIHGQDPPRGRQGRRHLQDVVHEFHNRPQSLLRRRVSRAGASRTHSPRGQIRRPEPARRDANDDHLEESILRNRVEHRARGAAGGHPTRACCLGWQESLFFSLVGENSRGRDSGLSSAARESCLPGAASDPRRQQVVPVTSGWTRRGVRAGDREPPRRPTGFFRSGRGGRRPPPSQGAREAGEEDRGQRHARSGRPEAAPRACFPRGSTAVRRAPLALQSPPPRGRRRRRPGCCPTRRR